MAIILIIADRLFCNYGPCKVTINNKEPYVITGGGKLLEALYQRKIFIPSACGGKGTCGFCKVSVLDGGGQILPTEEPFMTKEELGRKTRLACQVKIKQDIVIKVKDEYLDVMEYKAVVAHARMVTHDTREISLKLIEPKEIKFKPGQYVQVMVPGEGEPVYRAYSISSSPSVKNNIELLVRLIPGGLCSSYLHNVKVNEEITFTGPYGEFALDISPDNELICVGGGCGMAPMRSILRHLKDVAPGIKCSLYFGARTTKDIMYMEEFLQDKKLMRNFEIHYALSEPQHSPDWKGETGFIHESVARNTGKDGKRQAFLCGPPLMIKATMKVLKEKGFSRKRVFYDEF